MDGKLYRVTAPLRFHSYNVYIQQPVILIHWTWSSKKRVLNFYSYCQKRIEIWMKLLTGVWRRNELWDLF